MTTARYRGAYTHEIKPGACLWAPAGIFGVDDLDYRVNGGLQLVRILAQDALGKWVARCRPPAAREVRALGAKDLWVQLGAKGDPSQPTEVQESPDKPPTQLVYTQGIDAAQLGRIASAPAALFRRAARLYADSSTFKMTCRDCPLQTDDLPPGVCLMGPHQSSVVDQATCIRCPHYEGHNRIGGDGTPATYSVGCSRSREA